MAERKFISKLKGDEPWLEPLAAYVSRHYVPLEEMPGASMCVQEAEAAVYDDAARDERTKKTSSARKNTRERKNVLQFTATQAREDSPGAAPQVGGAAREPAGHSNAEIERALRDLDESFSEMLLRKIDEKGIKDAECYKKALVDRKLFSKIRSDRLYRPSKPTVIAFAFALELPKAEAESLLRKAGFALSRSSKFDVIVECFLNDAHYSLDDLNEALYRYDQPLVGYGAGN